MRIVAHVHDEVTIAYPKDAEFETACSVIGTTSPWLDGICFWADVYETEFYKKE